MNKRFVAILCSLVLILGASGALASTSPIKLTYAFTSDNYVTNFSLFDSKGLVQNFGSKESEWQLAASGSYNELLAGTTYTLKWEVVNGNFENPTTPTVGGDPMAFLGQFSVNENEYLSSSDQTIWQVNGGAPTSYGLLSDSSTIWYKTRNGYSLLSASIDDAAEWIGFGTYPGSTSSMTVSATFTTAPVPIPAAALLLGSGLLGLVGLRRRQMV